MELCLESLVVETTRRCNMKCPHCLRGNAQRVDMSNEIINKLTSQIDRVISLTFSGGEPSLNAGAIREFQYGIQFNDFHVESFWLTVNARFYKPEFEDSLFDFYSLCECRDECTLTISGDQYHFNQSQNAIEHYSELPFFTAERMKLIGDDRIVNEGMAKKNQFGFTEVNIPEKIAEYIVSDGKLYVGDLVYVNALGDVLLACDLSYQSQKKHILGNVLKEPLLDILMKNLSVTQNPFEEWLCG